MSICILWLNLQLGAKKINSQDQSLCEVNLESNKLDTVKISKHYTRDLCVQDYCIPLSFHTIFIIYQTCKDLNIECELIFAIIAIESKYDENAISFTGDYGLMGININAHNLTAEQALNPEFNVKFGINFVSTLLQKYKNYNLMLMAYNAGEMGANEYYWENGIFASDYSEQVMSEYNKLKGGEYYD